MKRLLPLLTVFMEPEFGLVYDLDRHNQCSNDWTVHDKSAFISQCVLDGRVNVREFVDGLQKTDQSHIVNFIKG